MRRANTSGVDRNWSGNVVAEEGKISCRIGPTEMKVSSDGFYSRHIKKERKRGEKKKKL